MENNLNFFKWKTTSICWQIEADLNILANGRRPKLFGKWKTTPICWRMEDNLNISANGRQPQFLGKFEFFLNGGQTYSFSIGRRLQFLTR
jgi:hypothetical protein